MCGYVHVLFTLYTPTNHAPGMPGMSARPDQSQAFIFRVDARDSVFTNCLSHMASSCSVFARGGEAM